MGDGEGGGAGRGEGGGRTEVGMGGRWVVRGMVEVEGGGEVGEVGGGGGVAAWRRCGGGGGGGGAGGGGGEGGGFFSCIRFIFYLFIRSAAIVGTNYMIRTSLRT